MITLHLCSSCSENLEEIGLYYMCTTPDCEMYLEIVGEDDEDE